MSVSILIFKYLSFVKYDWQCQSNNIYALLFLAKVQDCKVVWDDGENQFVVKGPEF